MLRGALKGVGEQQGAEQAFGGLAAGDQPPTHANMPLAGQHPGRRASITVTDKMESC